MCNTVGSKHSAVMNFFIVMAVYHGRNGINFPTLASSNTSTARYERIRNTLYESSRQHNSQFSVNGRHFSQTMNLFASIYVNNKHYFLQQIGSFGLNTVSPDKFILQNAKVSSFIFVV